MELYKGFLISTIYNTTIEEVDEFIKDNPRFTINRNEEGKMNSRYLGDRYEPAIIYKLNESESEHYYLFDGDVKDCTHPLCVDYYEGKIKGLLYYSSERIKNREPIIVRLHRSWYNTYETYGYPPPILSEYKVELLLKNTSFENFTLLCDEIH